MKDRTVVQMIKEIGAQDSAPEGVIKARNHILVVEQERAAHNHLKTQKKKRRKTQKSSRRKNR